MLIVLITKLIIIEKLIIKKTKNKEIKLMNQIKLMPLVILLKKEKCSLLFL